MTENLHTTRCIRTRSGMYVNVFEPDPSTILIEDIAHALSLICRWGGHCRKFYSVAQHSAQCAYLVDKEFKLTALLHDASEAYLLDIPRPIKRELPDYKRVEETLMQVIAKKFGITYPLPPEVKKIDSIMLELEWSELVLKDGFELEPWTHERAKQSFLNIYNVHKSN